MLRLYRHRGLDTLLFYYSWLTVPYEYIASFLPREGLLYDLGSGRGIFSNCLVLQSPERRVIGIESNLSRVRCARETTGDKINPVFYAGDIGEEEFEKCEAFSLINVLHHCRGSRFQERLGKRCYRALKPGGRLLVVEVIERPRIRYLLCCFLERLFHPFSEIHYRSKREMMELLRGSGFSVEMQTITHLSPYALALYVADKPARGKI